MNELTLYIGLIAFYLLFFAMVVYFLRKEQQNPEDYNKTEPFLHISLIRITLLASAIILPTAAFFRQFIVAEEGGEFDFWLLSGNGVISLSLFTLTFFKKTNLNTVKYFLLFNYAALSISILISLYISQLGWYYALGFIILISLSTSFINTIKAFLYFSITISVSTFIIVELIKEPRLQPMLFLFAVCCVLFVSLILFVKNNQRISFSENILNTTKALVIVSNNKGEIIFVNSAFKAITGYSDDELLGNGWWQVRKMIDGDKKTKEKLISGKIDKTSVVHLETKHGNRIWIQWENNRLSNGTTIAIGSDITEKQEKEREFKHIVENAKDIIYTTDKNGQFTYVNEIAVMVTGYSMDEFSKMNFKELIAPEHIDRVLDHNISELKKNNFETYIEFPVITKSKKEIWLGQQIIFKIDPVSRKFLGAQAICRDITERVKAEEQLSNYFNDLKTNYELKQSILGAKTIEALADTVLLRLIGNSRTTQFITLNFIQEGKIHIFYTDKFNKKVRETIHEYNSSIKEALLKLTSKNYHSFNGLNDVNMLHSLDQPKFAKNALIHGFTDNQDLFGFIGLYTDFEYDYAKNDTHFISDIANYIKTYVIEFEKNKIIEKKNKEIEAYSKQLEVVNENLATRNRFQEIVIKTSSFDELNNTILKKLNKDWHDAKSYSFNYYNEQKNELKSYFINKFNTFTFEQTIKLEPDQIEFIKHIQNRILNLDNDVDRSVINDLRSLNQPTTNARSILISPIKPQDKNKGFVAVYSKKLNVYKDYDLGTVIEIANVLQVALTQFENKQLIDQKNDEIEAQNKNLAILNEAQNKLINNLKVEDVFEDLLDLLFYKLTNIERASVLKFDFDKRVGLLHHISKKNNTVRFKDIPFDQIFILNSFLKEGVYDITDYDLKPELIEDEKKWYYSGIRSAYAIPIYINNKLYASINLFSNIPGNFNELRATINQIISSTQLIIDQLINKEIISEKNKNISANINYAKRIQDAFLPNEDNLKKVFSKSFALLQQRDALGGDFYWVKELNNYSLLAVGDCTGHGVSGALLSILSTTYLNTIIDKWQNYNPGIILDLLSNSIYNSFHQKNTDEDVNDGLDISFCTYNKADNTLLYSGAMQTIYLNRNGEIIEFKGSRKPIGIENKNLKANYEAVLVQLQSGDKIYMTSDGAIDQFSSANDKRLGNKRFKEILLSVESTPLKDRKRKILSAIHAWRENANQTDDICIVSFEVD